MCYLIYISTDFPGDLSRHNSALIRFEKDFSNIEPEVLDILLFENHHLVFSNYRNQIYG